LVIAGQKGGIGKTTIAMNLSVALAEQGFNTVLVDTDPQGAITLSLGKNSGDFAGLMEVITQRSPLEKALLQTKLKGLTLLPKGRLPMKQVPAYEKKLFHESGLDQVTRALARQFSFVVLDTPAGLGMITRAAMRCATHVLVPLKVERLSLRSINQMLQVIDFVQSEENPTLQMLGLVLNDFDRNSEVSQSIAAEASRDLPLVLDTIIPRSEAFRRAAEHGIPLRFLQQRPSPESLRFSLLAEEVLDLIQPEETQNESTSFRTLL
jgi:chromosome partitioning protein